MKPLIYAWPGHEPLAAAIAERVGGEVASMSLRRFPDDEAYVRLMTPPQDRDAILVCGLDRPDAKICGALFAADAARECGARSVGLVAPYLAYMRQDARFNPGEAVSSRTFAQWLSRAFDWLATVDPHLHRHRALGEIYSIPAAVASATGPVARWIVQNVAQPLIVGPDEESAQWAAAIARRVDCPWIVLHKQRRGDREVAVSLPDIAAWPGHTPVLVDDIVSTARTMAAAVRGLRELGAAAPQCIGVHGLFCGDALQTLRAAGAQVIATCNTIRHETNAIDVTYEIVEAVATLQASATRPA